jgi:hypothetical protein
LEKCQGAKPSKPKDWNKHYRNTVDWKRIQASISNTKASKAQASFDKWCKETVAKHPNMKSAMHSFNYDNPIQVPIKLQVIKKYKCKKCGTDYDLSKARKQPCVKRDRSITMLDFTKATTKPSLLAKKLADRRRYSLDNYYKNRDSIIAKQRKTTRAPPGTSARHLAGYRRAESTPWKDKRTDASPAQERIRLYNRAAYLKRKTDRETKTDFARLGQ